MGERLLHPGADARGMVVARHTSLYSAGDDGFARAAFDASGDRRRVQSAARGEFLVWIDPAAIGAGAFADRLFVALGPERFLGDKSGDQFGGSHAAHWSLFAAIDCGRARVWASHVDEILRATRRRAAGSDNRAGWRACLFVPPSRSQSQRAEAQAGCGILARPGLERWRCLHGGARRSVVSDS